MKRAFGTFAVALGLIVARAIRLPTLLLVWLHYFRLPFPYRVARWDDRPAASGTTA